ncbi:hypothetical protein [Cohaesibacter gelatinilyticus]|uniref:Uncharacterized protein n=1 Tax=Cohaesibacter gelatinilyticus TaxID=372072 RepID=A0A285PK81_9HYPH|nr:hypothetical protein [Cohaesibacter gelatinilyticus]SNZ21693.1 hypothetical protein SAMN06265368_4818 [Cohaesibacter gelatinilyticus]
MDIAFRELFVLVCQSVGALTLVAVVIILAHAFQVHREQNK